MIFFIMVSRAVAVGAFADNVPIAEGWQSDKGKPGVRRPERCHLWTGSAGYGWCAGSDVLRWTGGAGEGLKCSGLDMRPDPVVEETIMRRAVWVVLGFLSLAICGTPATTMAAGLIDPFSRDGINLDPQEWTLIKQSIGKVLDSYKAGAESPWEYAGTGRAGLAKVTRVFKAKGMDCAEVTHMFTKGGGARYIMPFCKVADGSWKVAF